MPKLTKDGLEKKIKYLEEIYSDQQSLAENYRKKLEKSTEEVVELRNQRLSYDRAIAGRNNTIFSLESKLKSIPVWIRKLFGADKTF